MYEEMNLEQKLLHVRKSKILMKQHVVQLIDDVLAGKPVTDGLPSIEVFVNMMKN